MKIISSKKTKTKNDYKLMLEVVNLYYKKEIKQDINGSPFQHYQAFSSPYLQYFRMGQIIHFGLLAIQIVLP